MIPPTLNDFVLAMHAEERIQHMTTPTRFHNILYLDFANSTPNAEVSPLKPLPGSDLKTVTCSCPLRNEPSSPMCIHHTVSFCMSTRWDDTPDALPTFGWSNLFLSPDPQNMADELYAKLFLPIITYPLRSLNVNSRGKLRFVSSR